MNFPVTPWTELHSKNRWCALLRKTDELVCIHDTLKDLDTCMKMLGLEEKVVYTKETFGRGFSKGITQKITVK